MTKGSQCANKSFFVSHTPRQGRDAVVYCLLRVVIAICEPDVLFILAHGMTCRLITIIFYSAMRKKRAGASIGKQVANAQGRQAEICTSTRKCLLGCEVL